MDFLLCPSPFLSVPGIVKLLYSYSELSEEVERMYISVVGRDF